MPTLIPCAELKEKIAALQMKFDPCYVLTADDMDEILDIIYSTSLCAGSDSNLDQDNIFYHVYPGTLTTTSTPTLTEVATLINNSPQFTVGEKQLPIFAVNTFTSQFNATGSLSYTQQTISYTGTIIANRMITSNIKYYILKDVGKGTYGSGGTALTSDNLFWLRDSGSNTIVTEGQDVVFYNVNTIVPGELNTPAAVVNASTGPFAVTTGNDYYFRVSLTSSGQLTEDYKIYRYTGAAGTFGTAGGSTANEVDFQLIEDSTTDIPTDDGIYVVDYAVPTVMTGADTIADVVNLMGDIPIATNQLVSFTARTVSVSTIDAEFGIVKFFWMGGPGTISGDSTVDDFLLYESYLELSGPPVITTNPPEVRTVQVTNLDNPEVGVNASSETYVIDGTADWYFYTVYDNPRKPGYKLYRWTGTNGTYGSGGATAVNGDFTLILESSNGNPGGGIEPTGFERIELATDYGYKLISEQRLSPVVGDRSFDGSYSVSPSGVVGAIGDDSITLGKNAYAQFDDNVVIGSDTASNTTAGTVIGSEASVTSGFGGTAIGKSARVTASGEGAVAIGSYAGRNANAGPYSIMIGYLAGGFSASTPMGGYGIAIGHSTEQHGSGISIGFNAESTNAGGASYAIGHQARANGAIGAIAFGSSAGANADGSISIGDSSIKDTDGQYAVAIGNLVKATLVNPGLSYGEVVMGTYPTLPTPNDITTYNSADRSFTIGIGTNNGARADSIVGLKSGAWAFPQYGSGTFAGTADYGLGVDSSGNIVEVGAVHKTKVTLSAAQILSLNTTPIEAVAAPGAGKAINVISASARLNFNTSVFDHANGNLWLIINGLTVPMFTANIMKSASSTFGPMGVNAVAANEIIHAANAALDISMPNDGTSGDSTVDVYITYEIVTL